MINNDKVYPLAFSIKTDNNTIEYKAVCEKFLHAKFIFNSFSFLIFMQVS